MDRKWIEEAKRAAHSLEEDSLSSYFASIDGALKNNEENFPTVLRGEYAKLFIHGVPHKIDAPPCSSTYLKKDVPVLKQMISEVLRFYEEAGFELNEDLQEYPDHIVHELEFLGLLASHESETKGGQRIKEEETQMAFFVQFILPWIPSLCDRIVETSQLPFYRFLGDLTRGFIDFERNYLGIPES
jgi:TorA maturation chaperone TorD